MKCKSCGGTVANDVCKGCGFPIKKPTASNIPPLKKLTPEEEAEAEAKRKKEQEEWLVEQAGRDDETKERFGM